MRATIASIHFAPVECDRTTFGFGFFRMPAVAPGAEPATIFISDKVQIEEGPYQWGQNGKRSKHKYPHAGETIARDVVGHWTQNGLHMRPDCRPGIFLVRERIPLLQQSGAPVVDADGIPQWRDATDWEKSEMYTQDLADSRKADRAYASALYVKANAMADNPKLIPLISEATKLGAKHYGLEAEWLKENAATDVKPCPMCTKIIARHAILCPFCHGVADLDKWAQSEVIKNQALKGARTNTNPQQLVEQTA